MSDAYGIKAIMPNDAPQILGWASARSVTDDALLEIWNGPTSASLVYTLDKDGQHQSANGTVSLPTYAWENDKDCGLYRIGANNIGFAIGGSKIIDVSSTGVAVTGTLSSTGALSATDLTLTGNLSVQGNTTIGNATGDALTFHPSAWTLTNAVTITGTWTNLGTVTTVDINGGTVDAAVIGGASAAAGTFTSLTATGAASFEGNVTIGNASGDALTFHPAAWTLTNAVSITGTWSDLGTVTTVDIDGGSIDGTPIGAAATSTLAATTGTFSGVLKTDDTTEATSTTAASLQTDGGLGVVKDARVGGDLFLTGDLTASGAGPHAIGTAALDRYQIVQGGSFTSGGGSVDAAAYRIITALTGAVGDTDSLTLLRVAGSIVTQGTDTNISVVSSVLLIEPTITNNLASAGKPDVAATLYVSNTPTEGDTNAAIYVASGNTNLDTLTVRSTATVTSTLTASGTIELGHASDTTLARVSAGVISVEGVTVATASNTLTLTNKSIAASQITAGTFAAGTFSFSGSTISSLGTVTTADINGGTIDGAVIGGASAAAGTFTTLSITSFGANWTNAGRTVADLGIVTTVDINGGTLDGVTIGGASAAAGTFTTVDAGTRVDVNSTQGVDVNPGSDADADLLTVGVTGTPRTFWDESKDIFSFTHGIAAAYGVVADRALELTDSGITTGLDTALFGIGVDTDTFLSVGYHNASTGGAQILAVAEDNIVANQVLRLAGWGGQADTTKTTAGEALVEVYAAEHSASAIADVTADGNVFGVVARVGGSNLTRFLVDEDGDIYSVTAAQTFDEHDDLALLNRYDIVRRDSLRSQYAGWVTQWESELISLGILGGPIAQGGMTNVTQLQRLQVGAIRQLGDIAMSHESRINDLESENATLRERLAQLEAA